ncbi:reverse transcriptase protein [Salix suchowensis]|nr:reverse transcriptase protein [Salix suchowensis]
MTSNFCQSDTHYNGVSSYPIFTFQSITVSLQSRYARGRGRALGQTLHFITKIKLQELEKQRLAFEAHAEVLEEANSTTDLTQRVELLLKAVRDWSGSGGFKDPTAKQIVGGKLDLEHLDLWLRQSKKDPCFSPSIIRHWGDTLEAHIRHNLSRFEYAHLFGSLLTEWTASGDSVTGLLGVEAPESSASSTPASQEEFVDMGRKEMVEQMEQLQEIIFKPAVIDVPAYHSYLDGLFSTDIGKERSARLEGDGCEYHRSGGIGECVNDAFGGLGVMVLACRWYTRRYAPCSQWEIPAFTDPDILDGLFLEYIGVKWQITFKSAFKSVFSSKLWKPSIPFIPRKELERRRRFIDASDETFRGSLESSRVENRKNHFFMSQLTNSTGRRHYDDGNGEESGNETLHAIQIKQRLIHVMMTDCLLNTALHKTHTVVRSDFEWFGPSLPHDSMLAPWSTLAFPNRG